MNRLRKIGLIVFLNILSIPIFAQETITVNLEQAVDIALNENPTIKIAEMEIQRQDYVKKETIGNLLPSINGTGNYTYNIMSPVMFLPEGAFGPGSGGAMRMGFDNSFNAGANLGLPLYMPTIYRTMKMNKQQMLIAVESARSSKIELANQVKKTYLAILLGENSAEVIKDNIDLAKQVVETSRNSYELGIMSEYDLITAEVQLSNLTPTLILAENSVSNARLLLNMLLSLPMDTKIIMEEKLEDFVKDINNNSQLSNSSDENSQLKQLDLKIGLLEHQLKIQKSLRLPTLNAFLQYQVLTQSNDWKISSYDWKGTAFTGLQLNIPIFAGNSKVNKEHQIRNTIGQVSMQRDYLKENVNYQIEMSMSNMIKSRGQMKSNFVAKTQAKKGYIISKTRYDIGAGTIIELNSSQVSLLRAKLNYAQSIFDYKSAMADYEKIIGKIK
ncbi:MAG: TolC family protein [Bacteroidetes bacterium]|nr:TolC family protein [Bacteroidota bacterium]